MSHHCHDEHHDDSGHSHGDGAEHDHSDDITPALQFSLYQHIDFDKIVTLNEATYGSGKAVIKKTWAERLDTEVEIESDADEQLLVGVPYVFSIVPQLQHIIKLPCSLRIFHGCGTRFLAGLSKIGAMHSCRPQLSALHPRRSAKNTSTPSHR